MDERIKNRKLEKIMGFTLVETMVAISILVVVVAGTLNAVQSGVKDSNLAKDQITAFWLAQEGMEFIKNMRDENTLHILNGLSTNWLAGLSSVAGDACYFGKTCTIDSNAKLIANCAGGTGTCPVLRQDAATGLYGYTAGWTATYFKREIQFQSLATDEVMVLMTISWTTRGTTKSIQVTESFFNR